MPGLYARALKRTLFRLFDAQRAIVFSFGNLAPLRHFVCCIVGGHEEKRGNWQNPVQTSVRAKERCPSTTYYRERAPSLNGTFFLLVSREGNIASGKKREKTGERLLVLLSARIAIGHFRVAVNLIIKARLSASFPFEN